VHDKVEVVAHEAVRVDDDAEELVHLGEALSERCSVVVVDENGASAGATVHHVVPAIVWVEAK
jgi:hypothetical protein